jgi:hypothetical protein
MRFLDADLTDIDTALAGLARSIQDGPQQHSPTETDDVDLMLRSPRALFDRLSDIKSTGVVNNVFPISYTEVGIGPLQKRLRELARNTCWAQGGIGLPDITFNYSSNTLMHGAASLTGRLRPDLTISRTSIVAIPFPVHSALQLGVRLAAQRVDAPAEAIEQIVKTSLLATPPAEPYAVATFRADELLAGGAWRAENVLRSGAQSLSINDALARTAAGEDILLASPMSFPWHPGRRSSFDFYSHLRAALLHLFLDVELRPHADPPGLYAVPRPPFPAPTTSDLLPPLFAVPYRTDAEVAKARFTSLNATHPLAGWISTHAERLSRDFAAPFNRVFQQAPWITKPDSINEALDRVAKARTDIPAPPQEAYVRVDENGWWRSR